MVQLRNICGLAAPATGWDALPAATDVTLEADIARIKYLRNTVYAHAEHASVDDATFNTYWCEIRDAVVRLGGVAYRAAVVLGGTVLKIRGLPNSINLYTIGARNYSF